MKTSIDIGVCTFRRTQITELLDSLEQLMCPTNTVVRVIIADNDDEPTARALAERQRFPFEIKYLHAPGRNISIARNAILHETDANYIAFVDDDETVDPNWLCALYSLASAEEADVVFGPVAARYPPKTPVWMIDGDFHSFNDFPTETTVETGATCNVLINRQSDAFADQRFDLALGKSGGEDTVFFRHIYERGGKMLFSPEAVIYEKVDPKRLSLKWLLDRKYRSGQSHAEAIFQTQRNDFITRSKLIMSASAKAAFCAALSAANMFSVQSRNAWAIRGALHLGVIMKCLGFREKSHYGQSS